MVLCNVTPENLALTTSSAPRLAKNEPKSLENKETTVKLVSLVLALPLAVLSLIGFGIACLFLLDPELRKGSATGKGS